MPKRDDLEKVTLSLRTGDFSRLREMYPQVGASAVVRKLVSDYVDQFKVETTTLPRLDLE